MLGVLRAVREGLRAALPVTDVMVVDPRFPAEEVRGTPPFLVLTVNGVRRNGTLMGGPPSAWRTVPNPEYPQGSEFPYMVEFIWGEENVVELGVHAIGAPNAPWEEEKSAYAVARAAWAWFRGPARFAFEPLWARVVNLTAIPAVSTFAPFAETVFGFQSTSFVAEVLTPTVVRALVPTIESVEVAGRYFATAGYSELRRAAQSAPGTYPCELATGERILIVAE